MNDLIVCPGCQNQVQKKSLCDQCGYILDNTKWVAEGRPSHNLHPVQDSHDVGADEAYSGVILTTAWTVAGRSVNREIEIITAECVFGMNVFRDIFAAVRDTFGGRSAATQKVLRDARKICLAELKKEAFDAGADAVIGVGLDYSEFSGGGKSMLFRVASGTAVKLNELGND